MFMYDSCNRKFSDKRLNELTIGDGKYELNAGDSYSIPGNQIHTYKVIEGGEVVNVFTPPREDDL